MFVQEYNGGRGGRGPRVKRGPKKGGGGLVESMAKLPRYRV